ncbi:MAG: N-acetylglucosamine-6-phosphate deacetylase [Pseudanabaenaceae cyanobacterium bins.68]|nr:N-acetylglucosamine-6-phosphate deacetylase [Pseudanabaenaceae cyanobacterium bins.68]
MTRKLKTGKTFTIKSIALCLFPMAITFSSLGLIDLQINGALGLAFNQLKPEHLPLLGKICELLWHQGVDYFLPTLVTTSVSDTQTALAAIATFQQSPPLPQAAQIYGVHLEGPFLQPQRRGAHPAEFLLPLTLDNLLELLGEYTSLVKLVTLAPELDPTGAAITYLVAQGIKVSLGHSSATLEVAQQAFGQGASMVTHVFNAMPSLHHRQPGLLLEALTNPQVYCGAIADGVHLHPQILRLLYQLKGDRLILVSDALAPIGLGEGNFPWDQRQMQVVNGTARLADGTLCGTTLPLKSCVENLIKWQVCDLATAVDLVTKTPRQFLGLPMEGIEPTLTWTISDRTELEFKRLPVNSPKFS